MELKTLKHHQFLKKKKELLLGDYLTDFNIDQNLKLYNLITDHILLVLLSTSCGACFEALETVLDYKESASKANICVLIDTDDTKFCLIKDMIDDRVPIYIYSKEKMILSFESASVPWGYFLNKKGQIIAGNAFSSMYWFEQIAKPIEYLKG